MTPLTPFRMKKLEIQEVLDLKGQNLAGAAVQIAPVSTRIPCYQGI
jgi:hypothetical protein